MTVDANLLALAHASASRHEISPALVCAVVEQESAWNTFAMRYEPAFRARYVAPLGLSITEEVARSISWGLMQVMGQVARENGFDGKYLSALCEPAVGLDCGCHALAAKIAIAAREISSAGKIDAVPHDDASSAMGRGIAPHENAVAPAPSHASPAPSNAASVHNGAEALPPETILTRALALWNGGADPAYPAAVLARMSRYL